MRTGDRALHDPEFLKRVWDSLEPEERKCLKLARVGLRDPTIVALDIEEATQAAYHAQRKMLLEHYHDGKGGTSFRRSGRCWRAPASFLAPASSRPAILLA